MFKNKSLLIGIAIALALGLGIGIFIFRKRKTNTAKVDRSQLPNGWNPDLIAKQLFDAMEGPNWSNDDAEIALEALNKLNDEQVKAVYNEFNTNYGDNSAFEAGSLRDWINDEYGLAATQIGYAMLERMNRLSLT